MSVLLVRLNNNMRCFEMQQKEQNPHLRRWLNNNMRCFEILVKFGQERGIYS